MDNGSRGYITHVLINVKKVSRQIVVVIYVSKYHILRINRFKEKTKKNNEIPCQK